MSDGKPGRGSDQFPLRLPNGMRERIKEAADKNGRSMNAEIVNALEECFPPTPSAEEIIQQLDALVGVTLKLDPAPKWRSEIQYHLAELRGWLDKQVTPRKAKE